MADVNVFIADADRYSIDVNIIVREPLGVQKVRAIDRFGIDIISAEFGCENPALFRTGSFSRERCPFQVEVTSCHDGPITLTGPLFSPDPRAEVPMPCDPLMCHETAECTSRQNLLVTQRNLILRMCEILRFNRERKAHYLRMMAMYYSIAFVLAALALGFASVPIYGTIIAVILGVAAAGFLGLAIFYNHRYNQAQNAIFIQEQELIEARIRFDDIVREVFANCCPSCIVVDVVQPRCS